MRRILATVAATVIAAVALAGCSSDQLAEQYKSGSGKNYVAGDGTVTEIAVKDRGAPIQFTGATETGADYSSADQVGKVMVVNFWYAACAPCRAEAGDLAKISREFSGAGGAFVGVNVRDQAATATSFEQAYSVGYPSIIDAESGSVQLAFAGTVPPNAVPTTLVLDKKHRVAARILGQLQSPDILETLVRDTIAEAD